MQKMKFFSFSSTIHNLYTQCIMDAKMRPDILKMPKNMVGKIIPFPSIGKGFLNRTLVQ